MLPRTWNSKGYKKFDEEKATEYAAIANEVFSPIYPVIAKQILERCRVERGLCLDVGTGAANLALALARTSRLDLCAVDFSTAILKHACDNIVREGLAERVTPIVGDVHKMPFADGVASLIVSRGSMRFWRNKPAAFREFKRVLRPGGKGYVGGGIGDPKLDEEISRKMLSRGADRPKNFRRCLFGKKQVAQWSAIMAKAGFSLFEIISDGSGFWVYFEKEDLKR